MEDNNLDWLKRQLTISEGERRQLKRENDILRRTIVELMALIMTGEAIDVEDDKWN